MSIRKALVSCFVVVVCLVAGPSWSTIPDIERQALIALYNSTNGAGWTDRTNWRNGDDTDFNDPGTECTWFGVTCDSGGTRVLELAFIGNGLVGELPPELTDLALVQTLWFTENDFTGPIPSFLGSFPSLQRLLIGWNGFTGAIPGELGGLSSLNTLYLQGNQLTGPIPAELGNLTHLRTLYLNYNDLSGSIPSEFGNLVNLWNLDLSSNELSGSVPASLKNLTSLRSLGLSWNELSGSLPSEMESITTLVYVYLDHNQFTGDLPTWLGNQPNLEYLSARSNSFTGSIPAGLGSSPNLEGILLDRNRLTGSIPPELGQLAKVEAFWVYSNRLSGDIPSEITGMTGLLPGLFMLSFNALHSDDPEVNAFLAEKADSGWQATQTLPPTEIEIVGVADSSIELQWSPIDYTGEEGGYEILYSESTGGPYAVAGRTADKTASGDVVAGLSPGTDYFLVVRTVTEPHASNQSAVISDPSPEISVRTTIDGGCGYILSPSSKNFGADGGSSSFRVNTADACSWTAAADSEWISITGRTSGSGQQTLSFRVEANSGPRRTGSIVVESSAFTITQEAPYREADFTISTTTPEVGEFVSFTADQALEIASWEFGGAGFGGEAPFVDCTVLAPGSCNEIQWAYAAAGSKQVTMELVDERSATKTLTVVEPTPSALVIPAAISQAGAFGTQWESDLRFFNPCSSPLEVTLAFEPENTDNSAAELVSRSFEIAPGRTIVFASLTDALPSLGDGEVSGAVRVNFEGGGSCSVVTVSRTFNDTTEGTLGLFVPALAVKPSGNGALHLTGLIQNSHYRSNLRLVNFGDRTSWAAIGLADAYGAPLGASRSAKVPARSTKQINDIAAWLGVENDLAPFTVVVQVGNDPVDGFATVIDNTTGDSVLYRSSFTSSEFLWLAGTAHAQGTNDSRWRTDVWTFNPTDAVIGYDAVYIEGDSPDLDYDAGFGDLAPWAITERLDLAGELLEGAETSGYLVFAGANGDPAPQIAARTYNLEVDGGTSGLSLRAFSARDLLLPGDTGYLAGVSNSDNRFVGFRTNLGLLNTDRERWASVRLFLLELDGSEAAAPIELSISPGGLLQFDVFKKLGLKDVSMTGTIEIHVLSGGGVAAYATEIDNVSQDSIYIPAQIVP